MIKTRNQSSWEQNFNMVGGYSDITVEVVQFLKIALIIVMGEVVTSYKQILFARSITNLGIFSAIFP